LAKQKASDEAEAQKQEAEKKMREEMARLAVEREEKQRAETLRRMIEEAETIKAAERELEIKKKALRDAQRAADIVANDDDDEEDDDGASVSTLGEQVCTTYMFPFFQSSLSPWTTLGSYEKADQTASGGGSSPKIGADGPPHCK
jgi:hypothetical protein